MVCSIFATISLFPCPHAPCLFHSTPIPGQPPIYIAIYVNDLIDFSLTAMVEHHFETSLAAQLCIQFMGSIEWFLGTYYEWMVHPTTGDVSVHLSQEAFTLRLLSDFQMSTCNPAPSPYCSGLHINVIPPADPNTPPSTQAALTT